MGDKKSKTWIVFVVLGVVVLAGAVIFFLMNNSNNSNNQNNAQNLNQNTFSSCQASTQSTPFGQGSYTITIIGIENGNCHWQFSLQQPTFTQTKDCNYPVADMSSAAFNHLFGGDKTGTECSSDVCKQQENLQQTYCN